MEVTGLLRAEPESLCPDRPPPPPPPRLLSTDQTTALGPRFGAGTKGTLGLALVPGPRSRNPGNLLLLSATECPPRREEGGAGEPREGPPVLKGVVLAKGGDVTNHSTVTIQCGGVTPEGSDPVSALEMREKNRKVTERSVETGVGA